MNKSGLIPSLDNKIYFIALTPIGLIKKGDEDQCKDIIEKKYFFVRK